jgi:chromosome segregation ATPase
VLVIGTVVAVLAAFGPVWVVRAGVVVSVLAAVLSCWAAWREVSQARRTHAAEMLAASKAHGAALSEERLAHASVVDVLATRTRQARTEVDQHRHLIVELNHRIVELNVTIRSLRTEVSTLRAGRGRDQELLQRREAQIADLQESVRARESELAARTEVVRPVRSIPRRMLAESVEPAERPESAGSAEDLRPDRTPEVVDLVASIEGYEVALPNYEGERKLA